MRVSSRLLLTTALAAALCPPARGQEPQPLPPPQPLPAAVPHAPAAFAGLPPSNARVFVLDGLDPFGFAGTEALAQRLRSSGYPHTKYGGWYEALWFEWTFRRAHEKDPSVRSVWIGYSAGSYTARWVANRLVRDGLPVAMVGYVGGDYIGDNPYSRPGNVPVVNVRGDGYLLTGGNVFANGSDISGASNLTLTGTRHFDLPRHPRTGEALMRGLNAATGAGGYTTPYGTYAGQ
jgi:hypothetical protein